MSDSPTFGGTISGGIQDISALLPLLRTEQCERHIGSALDRGFLYSSVTPISIFGSLGIIRASVRILAASVNVQRFQFLGAKALNDGGFGLSGTAASMIGMDGKRFLAECRLEKMLEEEHIESDNMVNLTVSLGKDIVRWNIKLVLSTLLISLAGLVPYIVVILDLGDANPDRFFPLGFGFPILRVFGSASCVIVAQFLIQIRLLIILKNRLLFICINQHAKDRSIEDLASVIASHGTAGQNNVRADPEANNVQPGARAFKEEVNKEENDTVWTSDLAAEKCVWALQNWLAARSGEHEYHQKIVDIYSSRYEKRLGLTNTWIFRWIILLLLFILAAGCISTIARYIGCFFLIQHSASSTGTLVWLGLEAALSVLRIIIWAANPSWDDSKGMIFELQLCEHPPVISTPINVDDILNNHAYAPLMRQQTFFKHIVPYTGPLHHFNVPDVDLYYIFGFNYRVDKDSYGLREPTKDSNFRSLFIVLFAHKEQISRALVKSSFGQPFDLYACSLHPVQGGSDINVKVGEWLTDDTYFLTRNPAFMAIFTAHYDEISFKLQMDQDRKIFFIRPWTMWQPPTTHNVFYLTWQRQWEPKWHPLTDVENAYLEHHILAVRKHKLSRAPEDWVFKQIENYVPASVPPVSGQSVANSEDLDAIVLYLERWDALEKGLLKLECCRFFEVFLQSYYESCDNHINPAYRKVEEAVRLQVSKRSANDTNYIQTRLEERLIDELQSAVTEETRNRRRSLSNRRSAHPKEPKVDDWSENDLPSHLKQFQNAVMELTAFVYGSPLSHEGENFMSESNLQIRADKFRSTIKTRFDPHALSKLLFPEFATANILVLCERRADGLFSALMSVDAALHDREINSLSIDEPRFETELRAVAKEWKDNVQPKAEWFVFGEP